MALFNMFLFKQRPADLYRQFIDTVIKATERCESDWLSILESEDIPLILKLTY